MSATLHADDVLRVATSIGSAALGRVERFPDGRRALFVAAWVRYRFIDDELVVAQARSPSTEEQERVRAREDFESPRWTNAFLRGRTAVRVIGAPQGAQAPLSPPVAGFRALHDGEQPNRLVPGASIVHVDPSHTSGVAVTTLASDQLLLKVDADTFPMKVAAIDVHVAERTATLVFVESLALDADGRVPHGLQVVSEGGPTTLVDLDASEVWPASEAPSSLPPPPRPKRRKADTAHLTTQEMQAVTGGQATPFRPTSAPGRHPSPPPRPSPPPQPSVPPHRASVPPPQRPSPPPPPIPGTPWAPRPPSPIEDQRWSPPPVPVSSKPEPAPAPPPAERQPLPTHATELLWMGEDERALSRARAWAQVERQRPRGLLPRIGPNALRPAGPPTHAWLADGRTATRADLRSPDVLFPDHGTSLKSPGFVVHGTLAFDVPLHAELEAVRASLRHLAAKSQPIADALTSTDDVSADPLTPVGVLRSALGELLEGAEQSSMASDGVLAIARKTLIRSRTYAELNVLGDDHVVARWKAHDGGEPWVAYLPKSAIGTLPLEPSFEVRAAVTVHPRQDPEEAGPHALRIHALARVIATDPLVSDA